MTPDERRANMVFRKTTLASDDGSFDRAFWLSQTPEARLEAVWQAVLDWASMTGVDPRELGLQRSLGRIERR
jgi:hypothetical protein